MKEIISISVLGWLILASSVHSQTNVRHSESSALFDVQIIEDHALVRRKADRSSLVISNVLWGEGPLKRTLPKEMIGKADSTLLLPMQDYSFILIDLKSSFENQEKKLSVICRIEGGGRKGANFDRTRAYWGLEYSLAEELLFGSVMDDRDKSCSYFVDLSTNRIIAEDQMIKGMLVARRTSWERDIESSFTIIYDHCRSGTLPKIERGSLLISKPPSKSRRLMVAKQEVSTMEK